MKLTIHVEGTKNAIASELRAIADDFDGANVETTQAAPAAEAPKAKRGRKPNAEKKAVEAEEEFEMPEADEPEEEEEVEVEVEADESEGIDDDTMRERAALFCKKKDANRNKLIEALKAGKYKNACAVPQSKREAFLKALGA